MRKYHIFSLLLFLCLLFSGCARIDAASETQAVHPDTAISSPAVTEDSAVSVEKRSRVVFAMDTIMELTVYSDGDAILDRAEERITELENKLSVTLPGSEIHTLNADRTAALSDDTSALLTDTLELCESTGGALDVTIYPIVSAWGFTTGNYQIPSDADLAALLERVDYTSVQTDASNVSIPDGVQVDLGSVAKGYTGNVLCGLLRENGVTSALLNLGGNVQALGSKPDGSPWRIAVQHPTDKENYLGILSLSNMAAITSGGYERYFTGDDGKTYWHIIDPSTGKPADSGLLSVTVVGENGLLCDAMSTALFVMGLDEASEYWRTHEGFDVIFVTDDGSVHITEGLYDLFTLSAVHADKELTVIER